MKAVFALAALAAIGFASTAFAGDATRTTSGPAAAPTAMSDSDMDKVTAGDPGKGLGWGAGTGSGLMNGHSKSSAAAAFTVGKGQGAAHSALHGPQ